MSDVDGQTPPAGSLRPHTGSAVPTADTSADGFMTTPAISRVYAGALGQGLNFAADRVLLDRMLQLMPGYRYFAAANRTFVRAAARRFVTEGITQILDLGCGIVSREDMTHNIAHDLRLATRVVYVDTDPVVIAHHQPIVHNDARLGAVHADICSVDAVLSALGVVLDLDQPVGVLAAAVLHCVPDEGEDADVATVMRRYHDALPAGSMLALTHPSGDGLPAQDVAQAIELFAQAGIPLVSRTREQIRALLRPWRPENADLDVLRWREGPDAVDAHGYTAIAHSVRGEVLG
jgi:SAM-dependent methyltransferase